MRSLLFVPGDSERKLEKGVASGADALIIDLEDSVYPTRKAHARDLVRAFLLENRNASPRFLVRINDLATGMAEDDLVAVMPAMPQAIVLPKACGLMDVERLSAMLRVHEAFNGLADGATRIVPIITETAAAVLAAPSFVRPHPRLAGLTWGAEDLTVAIGAQETRDRRGIYSDVFRLARALTLLAASAAETAPIDTVFIDFRNETGLAEECSAAARDGFVGKLAIHPDQVETINRCFTPTTEAVAEATAIVDAFVAAGQPGVIGIGGKMYDRPHLLRAERLLARSKALGKHP